MQGVAGRTAFELVGLRQQYVYGHLLVGAPVEHLPVELLERMTDIHQQNQPTKAAAHPQIVGQYLLPVAFDGLGHFGIAVAGQIDQPALLIYDKKIDELGAARGFAGAGQGALVG